MAEMNLMDDRERLLDELARVFAQAAVDALLLEQEADTKPLATSVKGTGRGVNVEQEPACRVLL